MEGLAHAPLTISANERAALSLRRGSIIIMDHHPLYRGAVRQVISAGFKDYEVWETSSLAELSELLDTESVPDFIVYDLATERDTSFAGLLFLRAQHPTIPIIVMSANDRDETIRRCLAFGVAAFLPKSLSAGELKSAMDVVVSGETWVPQAYVDEFSDQNESDNLVGRLMQLTCQEIRVLILLCEGLFNRQIAGQLGIAEATVKAHVSKILNKLGVYSRTQAVIAVTKIEPAGTLKAV